MKKIFIILTLLFVLTLQVYAYTGAPLLNDGANLLTDGERARLSEKLELLSDKHGFDIAVLTSSTLHISEEAAEALYESSGYRYDGVMLFVSMADRDWYILTAGECEHSVTYDEIGYISDQFLWDLSNGFYLDAFETFAEYAGEMATEEIYTDVLYDGEHTGGYTDTEGYSFGKAAAISFGAGLVLALIVTGIMISQLKTVKSQTQARGYMKQGSMRVTESHDLYLYSTVIKQRRSNDSSGSRGSSSRSSSGRSYGGRGGKF